MSIGLQYQTVKSFNCCLAVLARGFHMFFFFNERNLKQSDFNQELLIDCSQIYCFLWWLYLVVNIRIRKCHYPRASRNENMEKVLSYTSAQEDLFHGKHHVPELGVPGWSFFRDV